MRDGGISENSTALSFIGAMMWLLGQLAHAAPFIQKFMFMFGAGIFVLSVIKAALVLRLFCITEFAGTLCAFLPETASNIRIVLISAIVAALIKQSFSDLKADRFAIVGLLICIMNAVGMAYLWTPVYLLASGLTLISLAVQLKNDRQKSLEVLAVCEMAFAILTVAQLAFEYSAL
jgi:hypothetical protein